MTPVRVGDLRRSAEGVPGCHSKPCLSRGCDEEMDIFNLITIIGGVF